MRALLSRFCLGVFVGGLSLGCQNVNKPDTASTPTLGGAPQATQSNQLLNKDDANRELITLAKDFATSDARKQDLAWKTLNSYSRSDLVNSLSQLRKAGTKDETDKVAIAFVLCNLDFDYGANKRIIVTSLIGKRPYPDPYSDWESELIGRLIRRGDKNLLRMLFGVVKRSDGGWSEELSGIFERELTSDPEAFLLQLKSVPRTTRQELYKIFPRDMAYEDTSKIKAYLRSVPQHSGKGQVAKELLTKLSEAESRIRKGEN